MNGRAVYEMLDAVLRTPSAPKPACVANVSSLLEAAARAPPIPSSSEDSSYDPWRRKLLEALETAQEAVRHNPWKTGEFPSGKLFPHPMMRHGIKRSMCELPNTGLKAAPDPLRNCPRPRPRRATGDGMDDRRCGDTTAKQHVLIALQNERNGRVQPPSPLHRPIHPARRHCRNFLDRICYPELCRRCRSLTRGIAYP